MKTGGKFITSTCLAAAVGTKKLFYLIIQSFFSLLWRCGVFGIILKGQIFLIHNSNIFPQNHILKAVIDILDLSIHTFTLDVFKVGKHLKIISHIFVILKRVNMKVVIS